MNKLPSDFSADLYGMHVRLVKESDAAFIIRLRTDPKLSRFIHDTSSNLDDQISWIRHYKERERAGVDYYFIYSINDIPFALNRIYNIHDNIFTSGSWVAVPNVDFEYTIATSLVPRIIGFGLLDLDIEDDFDGCHEDNKKVLRLMRMEGFDFYGSIQDVKGRYLVGRLTRDAFETHRPKIEKLINLTK